MQGILCRDLKMMENLHLKTYSNEAEMQEFRDEFTANINAAIAHAKEDQTYTPSLDEKILL